MIRFPRTLKGWKTFAWLACGCCPIHHSRLSIDWPLYDTGTKGYCFKCEGVGIWPMGIMTILRGNAEAHSKEVEKHGN